MTTAVVRNSVKAAACAVALAGALIAGAAPSFASADTAASPASAQNIICRYTATYGSAIYPDDGAGGVDYTHNTIGNIAQGSTVTAFSDVIWTNSVGVQFRKLSGQGWALAASLTRVPNQTCFS